MKKALLKQLTKNELESILKNSKDFNSIFSYLKINKNSKNVKILREQILKFRLENVASHLDWRGRKSDLRVQEPIEILKLDQSCHECSLKNEWNNFPLTLKPYQIVDEKANLSTIMLCPNCLSQIKQRLKVKSDEIRRKILESKNQESENVDSKVQYKEAGESKFCSKCSKEMHRPAKSGLCKECLGYEKQNKNLKETSKEELERMFWDMPSTEIAELFEISDTYLSRYAKKLGIKKPGRGYWTSKR